MKLWSEVAHPTSSWTQRADRNRPGVRPVRVRATPPCERTCSRKGLFPRIIDRAAQRGARCRVTCFELKLCDTWRRLMKVGGVS